MNKLNTKLAIVCLIFTAPLAAQASDEDSLQDQIRFYHYSVTQSSVSPALSEQSKSQKLRLLENARRQVELGHDLVARELLRTVAQRLYRMPANQQASTQAQLGLDEANAISKAIESILPQAHRIAMEKQADQEPLHRVMLDHQIARAALEANDMTTASSLLQASYRVLKQTVADLRAGDQLIVKLPEPNSREGWMDAAHRYLDWRYFNRQLLAAARDRGIDTTQLVEANRDADQIYDLASSIALQGDWKQAVATVDRAYRILEKAWQNAGVDVGV